MNSEMVIVFYSSTFSRTCPGSVASTLDTNKYKFLMKIAIDDLEIVKGICIYIIDSAALSEYKFKKSSSNHLIILNIQISSVNS